MTSFGFSEANFFKLWKKHDWVIYCGKKYWFLQISKTFSRRWKDWFSQFIFTILIYPESAETACWPAANCWHIVGSSINHIQYNEWKYTEELFHMIQHVSETVFVHLRLIKTECPIYVGFFCLQRSGIKLFMQCVWVLKDKITIVQVKKKHDKGIFPYFYESECFNLHLRNSATWFMAGYREYLPVHSAQPKMVVKPS